MPAPSSPVTVCTLWEKDFHKGVGALVNSLDRAGYSGKVWAGYRGDLPTWATAGTTTGDIHTFTAKPGLDVVFVHLSTSTHLSQVKMSFMRRVMEELETGASAIYYLDPDIMLLAGWDFFERWLRYGIAVCEDGSYPINPSHPLVRGWQEYAASLGYTDWHAPGAMLNSGLVGITRQHLPFLRLWQHLMDCVRRDFPTGEVLKTCSRTDLFHCIDQDALSLAAGVTEYPISWVGPDGMGFERGEWLTIHAYSPKPWRRRVLRDLFIEGHKPDTALRQYWNLAGSPVPVEPASRVRNHRWLIPLAALLSRVYRRGS